MVFSHLGVRSIKFVTQFQRFFVELHGLLLILQIAMQCAEVGERVGQIAAVARQGRPGLDQALANGASFFIRAQGTFQVVLRGEQPSQVVLRGRQIGVVAENLRFREQVGMRLDQPCLQVAGDLLVFPCLVELAVFAQNDGQIVVNTSKISLILRIIADVCQVLHQF